MGLKSIIVPTIEKEEVKTIQGVETITDQLEKEVDQLNRMIENEPKIIKGGSQNKQKRRRIKKYVRKLKEDYLPRLKKYREQMATFGDRNSYAKMDPKFQE